MDFFMMAIKLSFINDSQVPQSFNNTFGGFENIHIEFGYCLQNTLITQAFLILQHGSLRAATLTDATQDLHQIGH